MSFLSKGSRPVWSVCALAFALLLPFPTPAKEMGTLRVIVEDAEGEPVSRASVIISRLKKNSNKPKGDSLQLKTSMQGTTPVPPLQYGRYMLQVISKGFQTYGDEIVLEQTEQSVTVTLKPPQDQFSVHEDK